MAEDKSSRVVRNALITSIVAILMNPVSVLVGYYLNQTLQKPKLSIEYVSETYYVEPHVLSPSVAQALSKDPELVAVLRDALTRMLLERGGEPCTAWLDAGAWKDDCLSVIREVAYGFLGSLRTHGTVRAAFGSERAIPQNAKAKAAALQALLAELNRMENDTERKRTGSVAFPVGILNTGDSAGIVSNKGEIRFDGHKLWLSGKAYTAIKALSFEEVEFTVPESDQDPAALAKWKDMVRSRKEMPFEIVLSTAGGTIVRTTSLSN